MTCVSKMFYVKITTLFLVVDCVCALLDIKLPKRIFDFLYKKQRRNED